MLHTSSLPESFPVPKLFDGLSLRVGASSLDPTKGFFFLFLLFPHPTVRLLYPAASASPFCLLCLASPLPQPQEHSFQPTREASPIPHPLSILSPILGCVRGIMRPHVKVGDREGGRHLPAMLPCCTTELPPLFWKSRKLCRRMPQPWNEAIYSPYTKVLGA